MRAFRPGLVPTLVVFALLPGLIALGCWQLGRAAEKRALLGTYAERRVAAPLAVDNDSTSGFSNLVSCCTSPSDKSSRSLEYRLYSTVF